MGESRVVRSGRWHDLDSRIESLLRRRDSRGARDLAFADALRVIAGSTRSGASLQQALRDAADRGNGLVAEACREASARIALGWSVEEATDSLAERIGSPSARLFAQVVRVQHRRGGELGGACHRLAALLHERVRLDSEARSATAQARFSARAVLAIPLLLAIAAAWRAPEATMAMLRPGALLLAVPGVLMIIAGGFAAHRIAAAACDLGGSPTSRRRPAGGASIVARMAGGGELSKQAARLAACAGLLAAPLLAIGASPVRIACAVAAVGCAAAWPWSNAARARRERAVVARTGIESLLEVSIALFAAGATAHQVATIAPASCDEPLRSALAPAVHHIGLGRSIASAFAPIPEIAASPQLDGWLHAVCASADLGTSAGAVLEQLLRDARSARREHLRQVAQTAAPRMQLALVLLVVPGIMWLMLLATIGGLVEQLRASGVV
jgi:Flp pilus assembly protein TadB